MMPAPHVQRLAAAAVITFGGVAIEAAPISHAPTARSIPVGSALLPPDLCSLLTKQEAETILGKRLEPPQIQRNGDCWYLNEGGKDFGAVALIISVLPVQMTSTRQFDGFIAEQVEQINESLKKAGAKGETFTAEPVRELDAPAYYVDPGLFVLKGRRVLMIGIDRPQAVAIAAKALPRFQP